MLAIYCRISREKEKGKDRSITDQKLLGIELSKKLDIQYEVYIDEGISGTSDISDRPEFSRMLDNINDGKITAVYAYDQSRLERRPEVRFIFKKLLKDNNTRLYDQSGEINLNDESTEFFGDLMSLINQYYVKMTQKKIKSVLRRNASQGKAHSSILPYGYKKDEKGYIVIDKEEAKIVKRVYKLSLSGIGVRTIANIFNDEKIPTRYNKIGKGSITTKNKHTGVITKTLKKDIRWSSNTLMGIVKNSIYKGVRVYSGNTYPAPIIIDPNFWEEVNNNIKKNRNNSGKKVNHLYLLKGLLTCSNCGRNYYGRTRVSKKDNYYMCSSKRIKHETCKNRGINIDGLEKFIWQNFFTTPFLLNEVKEFINNKKKNDTKAINLENSINTFNDKLKELENQRKRAINLTIKGIVKESELSEELKIINKNIKEINYKLKNDKEQLDYILQGAKKHSKTLESIWKDSLLLDNKRSNTIREHLEKWQIKNMTPFNYKRELINTYIKRIYINFFENVYSVSVEFKIPIEKQIYLIDKKYTYALNLKSSKTFLINKDKEHLMLNKLNTLKKIRKDILK